MAGFVPRCHVCGRDIDMPYRCSYCDNVYCSDHRLPESHQCHGAQKAAAAARERRRTGHPGVEVQGGGFTTSTSRRPGHAQGGGGFAMDRLGRLEGDITKYLLVAIGVVWALESIILAVQGEALFTRLFVLDANWLTKPWTLITSVLAHSPFPAIGHILVNGVVLFFFGPLLEKRVGSRLTLYLILGGGALAGLAQIGFYETFLGTSKGVVGLSGGLMALMGALTLLGPRIRVLLFFFLPMPLWALTGLFVVIDSMGLLSPTGSIAHLAHLAGLFLGLGVGWWLRRQGYAFPGHVGQISGGMGKRPGW